MNESDYAVFASAEFDVNEYANAVLAGELYPAPAAGARAAGRGAPKEDVSVVIAKLDAGLEDVSKQLKGVVTSHHEELLVQAAGVSELQGSLKDVRSGLNELESSLEKLRLKIRVPYQTLQSDVVRLEKLHQASDILRRTARFVVLARRLESQMTELDAVASAPPASGRAPTVSLDVQEDEKERTVAKAALTIAELVALLDATEDTPDAVDDDTSGIPLRSLSVVASHVPFIEDARSTVTAEMESTVLAGLTNLNQALLASSLQTAHNLRVLPTLVHSLVTELSAAVESRIRSAFDMALISKDALAKEPPQASQGLLYKSRIRTEPTNVTQPQWANALWGRLEVMIEEMAGCCIKVYTLEKVLRLRKDHVTQVVFLDEAMKELDEKPTLTFWHALASALDKQAKDTTKGSTFLQQTLSTGYPRLLRLFHDFFAKISVHTDTVYSQTYQSPETILVLRALSSLETLFISKASIRLNEAVAQAFVGGARSPPGANEGVTVARAIANELDGARFDPLLVKAVARTVRPSMDLLLSRVDGLVVRDRSSVSLIGPSATPQQMSNAQIASFLWHCRNRVGRLKDDYTEATFAILAPELEGLEREYAQLTEPLVAAVRRDVGALIARLHKADFGDGAGAPGGGASAYMRELVDKLAFIKTEVFANYNIGEARRNWSMDVARQVLRTFVMHASLARPLGEAGKLQLTTDMTELEFALSAFVVDPVHQRPGGGLQALGDDYKMLRAMRPLLFLDTPSLASPQATAGVPPLVVLHHVLVRSPLPLPHALHGWQEAEYVRWVAEHAPRDALALVDGGLARWERVAEADGRPDDGAEFVRIARAVLAHAGL